ncbi:MAG: M48 family metallopeptidase [Bacteroidales bacterium]|nr:M48 family metallopeptidase [Bacteroidales bacterium]
MQQKIVDEKLGPITVRFSEKTRYMRLRVDLKNGIMAVVPKGLPEKHLLKFIHDQQAWLKKAMYKQQKIKTQLTLFTLGSIYTTRNHRLYLLQHEKNTVKSLVSNYKIQIWYPSHADVSDERIQKVIRKAVLEAWRIESKIILPERVSMLAQNHGFRYSRLSVKNAKTRWGSCSSDNNINLNLQLMRLPDELIDYVILHELNHTVHKHHQKEFWSSLERILPGAKSLDKTLNGYHLEIW